MSKFEIVSPHRSHRHCLGIFTICPTIKPQGGFFTRPEFRAFATYAIWSKALEGSIGGTIVAGEAADEISENPGPSVIRPVRQSAQLAHPSKPELNHRAALRR